MRGRPVDFWGKLSSDPEQWHPLIDHCADVAACCEALLRRTLIRRRLATLGERNDLIESDIQRLSALAAFHDAGKFNLGFQNKADPNRRPMAGHVQAILDLFGASASIEQKRLRDSIPLAEIQTWAEDATGLELLVAAIAHHGRPGNIGGNSGPNQELWRRDSEGRDPFEGIARLSAKVREWVPAAFDRNASPLPSKPAFAHAFCGLVTLADWIGSDRSVFSFSEEGDPERISFARRQAQNVLGQIGLDLAAARAAYQMKRRGFDEIFDFIPNAAQRRIMELPIAESGGLAILESETGSGKTEAALARFFKLFDAGLVDGMYFALPTRTAAVQIHRRIANAVACAFPDAAARPPVILAVPGYLPLDDKLAPYLLAQFDSLWNDHERWRFLSWAGEHPKRYLAGAISVGTVDQALLSALMVSHSHLRATSLLRQFLVVDEVHASDAYMATILREVLRFHLAAGGHAMLLSATLGSRAATTLISAGERFAPKPPPLDEAENLPYPSVTTVAAGSRRPEREVLMSESRPKVVTVELTPAAADFAAAAARAMDAATAGARVLIVRNTVRECVATQLELERIAGARGTPHLLFAVNDHPAPHHARFARADRFLLDHELEERFGKSSAAPCVAAATQTVQQSLDLDADLMLTDLCPIDVMLQRIGRLHRHRRDRPEPFRAARVIVLTPAIRDLTPLIGRGGAARGEHGFGTVYEDLRVLEATWRVLEATLTLEIPAMNRRLVEAATHPDAISTIAVQLGGAWKKHGQSIDGGAIAEKGLARLNCVNRDDTFPDCRFPSSLEARIHARLGEGDRIVEFSNPIPGPFGATIDRLTIPGWLVRNAPADAKVDDVATDAGTIRFSFAGRAFIYDRLGLHPAESQSNAEEDIADA